MHEDVEFFIAAIPKDSRTQYTVVCNTGGRHLYVSPATSQTLKECVSRIANILNEPRYQDLKFLNSWDTYTGGEAGNLGNYIFYSSGGARIMYLVIDRHSSKTYNFKEQTNVDLKPPVDADRSDASLADKYPKYYKRIPEDWKVIDVYGVHHLFPIANDDSGCIRHSSKKLLLPGVRTGGKSFYKEIVEARDTLNRWLELNKELIND